MFDVLKYMYNSNFTSISREDRVVNAQSNIFALLNDNQKEFLEFVLAKYIETGVEELDEEKLPKLLELKYYSLNDGALKLGGVKVIRDTFIGFQKWLYEGGRMKFICFARKSVQLTGDVYGDLNG